MTDDVCLLQCSPTLSTVSQSPADCFLSTSQLVMSFSSRQTLMSTQTRPACLGIAQVTTLVTLCRVVCRTVETGGVVYSTKGKGSLPSVGPRADPGVQAASPQMT